MRLRHVLRAATAAAVVIGIALPACSSGGGNDDNADLIVGKPKGTSTSTTGPRLLLPRDQVEIRPEDLFVDGAADSRNNAEPGRAGVAQPDGTGWPVAVPFTSDQPVPEDLVFVLVAGSDARPREQLAQTRADSIHLVALNPRSRQGTILGFPRDSYVEIPGHGRGKINSALAMGGMDLLAQTVRRTTGLPIHYYALTGFTGLTKMVDELGGVDINVDRRMNDKNSGARFERGWHHMTGGEVLAFTRDRTTVENGDFTRSQHHGEVLLAALAKMRGEVGDDGGVARWVEVLLRHAKLDVPLKDLPALAAFARRIDPARLTNAVAPGRIGSAGAASVVYLTKAAAALFDDIRDDAVIGTAETGYPPDAAPAPAAAAAAGTEGTATEPQATTTTAGAVAPPQPESTTTTTGGFSPFPIPGRGPSSSTSSTTTTTAPEETTSTTGPFPVDRPDDEDDRADDDDRNHPETTTTTADP